MIWKFHVQLKCYISRLALQRGVKGDAVTAYARVEFGKTLGETNKAEIGPDGITKFNFNASIEVNLDDPSAIDEICHRYDFQFVSVFPAWQPIALPA